MVFIRHPALLNITGPIPGPLNVEHYIPFAAPNTSAVGAGGQGVFVAQGVDIIVIRELIGGAYFGERKELGASPSEDAAWDTMIYSVPEVQRITRVAAQVALAANPPLPIHSIDKANVLASSRLWRKVATETLQSEFPQLKLDHHLVDSASMLIVSSPKKLNGVILTENLFGDM